MSHKVKIFSFVVVIAILFSSVGTPVLAAPDSKVVATALSASVLQTQINSPSAATCWEKFYNRGWWFEIIMDRCAAKEMISSYNGAWKWMKPIFVIVLGSAVGEKAAGIVAGIMSYGFTWRVNNALAKGKNTLSLSALWISFPFPAGWAINVY